MRWGSLKNTSVMLALVCVLGAPGAGEPPALGIVAADAQAASPSTGRRTIVTIRDDALLHATPGGRFVTANGHAVTERGSAWVLRRSGSWLQISTAQRRNASRAWIRRTPRRVLSTTRLLVRVRLSTRRVRVTDGTRLLMSAPVAIGSRRSPSPLGPTSISARIPITAADGYASTRAYGPVVVALRRWQALPSPGLPSGGILAFHGGNGGSVGTASSGGCFRMRRADLLRFARLVRAGTPVIVSR